MRLLSEFRRRGLGGNDMSMDKKEIKGFIESGKAVLGIEFGSTRIKAVLVGEDNAPIA